MSGGSDNVRRFLVTGEEAALQGFHLRVALRLNAVERRGQTVLYTCMREDADIAMQAAYEAGVTVQEWSDDTQAWEVIAGEGPGWQPSDEPEARDEVQPEEIDDTPDLGPCCICEGTERVYGIVMLHKKAPIPGKGWGCVVCDQPNDGALAVVCDDCVEQLGEEALGSALRFACRGYPAKDGRVSIEELTGSHHHDMRFHPEMADV